MLTQDKPKPPTLKEGGGPLSSRNGSIAAAVLAAVLAGAAILVFLQQYKSDVNADAVPRSVLVADKLIEKGASAEVASSRKLITTTDLPHDQVKPGALTDPAVLRGRVAVGDILPGQQITAADFSAPGKGIVTKLAADQRALAIALDGPHGLIGTVVAGDQVDVIAAFGVQGDGGSAGRPVVRTLMQAVPVLAAPPAAGAEPAGQGTATSITLRVKDTYVPKLAFAAEHATLRLVLRPQDGTRVDADSVFDLESVLFNKQPLKRRSR